VNEIDINPRRRDVSQRVGFLLSQVGGFAASRFAERLTVLGLQPSDVGILRLIAIEPGMSQQTLAARLGVGASRVVVLIDELERKDLLARERSTKDRRNYELRLTDAGLGVMSRMREIGADHENDLVKALSTQERETLARLLIKISQSHDLTPDVHPGYRSGTVKL
jgi:DNA-binding MarR family transcriptional regulator